MKNFLFILFFFVIVDSIFSKDEKPKESTGNDLVCKQIRIIAGDNSPIVKMLSELSNPKSEGEMLSIGGVIRCENSSSICYAASGSAFSCHKK